MVGCSGGFIPEALIGLDARVLRASRGLARAAAIICDAYAATGTLLSNRVTHHRLPLLAETECR